MIEDTMILDEFIDKILLQNDGEVLTRPQKKLIKLAEKQARCGKPIAMKCYARGRMSGRTAALKIIDDIEEKMSSQS